MPLFEDNEEDQLVEDAGLEEGMLPPPVSSVDLSMLEREPSEQPQMEEADLQLIQNAQAQGKASRFPLLAQSESYMKAPKDQELSNKRDRLVQSNKGLLLGEALTGLANIPAAFKGVEVKSNPIFDKARKQNEEELSQELGKRKDEEQSLDKTLANVKTEDTLDNDAKMKDPNSLISQVYRQAAFKVLPDLPETTTAKDLEKILPNLRTMMSKQGKLQIQGYNTKDGQEPVVYDSSTNKWIKTGTGEEVDVSNVTRSFAPTLIKDPNTGDFISVDRSLGTDVKTKGVTGPKSKESSEEASFQNLNPKQKERIDQARESVLKDPGVKESREALQTVNLAESLLAQNIPGSGGAIKRSLLKMFESGGRFTDQDVQQFGGSQAVLDRVDQIVTDAGNGRISEQNKKYLTQILGTIKKERAKVIESGTKYYTGYLEKQGLDKKLVKDLVTSDLVGKKSVVLPKAFKPGSTLKIKGKLHTVNEDGITAEEQ